MTESELDADAKVIAELLANGADPAKPHELDFFFYLPNRESAEALRPSLVASGLRVDVLEPDPLSGAQWTIQAWLWLPLEHSRISFLTSKFERLAAELGGQFDGWGAEVVE